MDKTFETYKEKTDRKFPFDEMEHRRVEYEKLDAIDKSLYGVPFTKEPQFVKQKEYRFVLRCKFPNIIDSLIFCRGIDYMEPCFVNPTMCKEQKEELKPIILYPGDGYGDFEDKQMDKFIANFNDLF